MSYFVFDQTASQAIRNHINGINLKKKSEEYYLDSNIALFLKDELKNINPFCQQLNFIGNYIYDLEKDARKTAYYNYMDTTFGDVLSKEGYKYNPKSIQFQNQSKILFFYFFIYFLIFFR